MAVRMARPFARLLYSLSSSSIKSSRLSAMTSVPVSWKVQQSTVRNLQSISCFAPILTPSCPTIQSRRGMARPAFTRITIEDSVLLVLKLFDKINPQKLTLESHFHNDLGLDSLDHVEIIMAIEDEYSFEIPDMDAQKLLRPVDIVQYLCDKFDVYDYLDREGNPIPDYAKKHREDKAQECAPEDPWANAGVKTHH